MCSVYFFLYIYIYNVGKHQWRLCVCQCGNASNHRRDGELGKNTSGGCVYVSVVMHQITGGMGSWGRTFSSKTCDPRVFSYLSWCMTAVSFSYWTYSFLVGMGHTTPLWPLALLNGWREWQRDSELICSCQIPITLLAVRILKFSVFLSDLIIF